MTVFSATTRVACNTSTGTQDITISGFGTPVAALFWLCVAVTDGTGANHINCSFGAATGTANEWALTWNAENGQTTTDNGISANSTQCIRLNNEGVGSINGTAEFTAFITDGVRINWTDAPAGAYLLQVVLIGGTDVSAHANNVDLGDAVDNAVDVTAPGFEPDVVIVATIGGLNIDTSGGPNPYPSFGIVHNGGASIAQHSFGWHHANGSSTANFDARIIDNRGCMQITNAGAEDWAGEFGSFDSSGFTVTTRTAGANGTDMMYLALAFNSAVNVWSDTVTTPTSTGNQSQTGPGFTPQIVFGVGTMLEAVNTAYNNSALAGSFGFFAFDGTREYMTSCQGEEGATTTNTQSLSDNTAVELPDDDGAAGLTASYVSFDANGWTWNFSAVETNAKQFIVIAIEEEAGDVVVSPTPANAIGRTVDPTPILGSVAITPTAANGIGQIVEPTVLLGSVIIAPTPANGIGQTVDPTVILGSLTITPTPAGGIGRTVAPMVVLGSLTLTPTPANGIGQTIDPTVIEGGVTVSPTAASGIGRTVDPTVVLGSIAVIPTAANGLGRTIDPSVILGSLTLTPTAANGVGRTVDPTVIAGGNIIITPPSANGLGRTIDPSVILGSLTLTPTAANGIGRTVDPTTILGALSLTPTPANGIGRTIDPTVIAGGGVTISPTPANAVGQTVDPSVILGSLIISLLVANAIGRTVDPFIIGGVPLVDVTLSDQGVYVISLNDQAVYGVTGSDQAVYGVDLTDVSRT